jgi:endonuclease YncB( thermonuclease family)
VRIAAWVLWSLCFAAGAGAETAKTFTARVIAVTDGDTVTVLQGNKKTTVRLADIDAPEIKQPWGSESRAALTKLALRKEVRVTPRAVDDYGRVVAVLEVDGGPGHPLINLNHEQVRRGMAWADTFHNAGKTAKELQAQAQRARLGLWNQANPQPPWAYRRGEGREQWTKADTPGSGEGCGSKRYCSQMVSCEEARHYFTQCGVKRLDRDGNDVPCENLCGAKAR